MAYWIHIARSIDRVTLHKEGGRVVRCDLIDYKTDSEPPDVLRSTYKPQIEAYRRALEHLVQVPPEAIHARLLLVGQELVVDL